MTSKAEKRLLRKLTVENLWMYIIAALKDSPSHAYGVRVALREKFGINVPSVTVYTVLYRMVREGLLAVEEVGSTKVYEPTEKGLKALEGAKKLLRNVVEELDKWENSKNET